MTSFDSQYPQRASLSKLGVNFDDDDLVETEEWISAFESVIAHSGPKRASYLLNVLQEKARRMGLPKTKLNSPYVNSIAVKQENLMPGDLFVERKIRSLIRWNALAMVLRANLDDRDLGGHIATFASSATLYDVGFNYFFRAPHEQFRGDLLYIQGHSAPGIYARAFLEGRLTKDQLDHFRQESKGKGLSSYPHPYLMPDFWQFPTVSMGLGPMQAIYQAHFMKYLQNRLLIPNDDRKVWAFLGDGEMDEPESLGSISLASREKLDNLIFVINCNLQRLDGPVRGNGKIIQELERVFRGASWNVIKVIWGRHWDPLLAKDKTGALVRRMNEVVDGEYQSYKTHGGAYTREHFFGKYPELAEMVSDLSDDEIYKLNRGGHDPYKVFAAYAKAVKPNGKPTVILAKTVKGYGLGEGESVNKTHQLKKLHIDSLKAFRDRYDLPIDDEEIKNIPYYHPGDESPEIRYLKSKRETLGGYLPQRRKREDIAISIPSVDIFSSQLEGSTERETSTTMVFVRLLSALLKQKSLSKYIVPIVSDEARTFGMEGLFRQLGIYSSEGQLYEPEDFGQFMYYREDKQGQILEEGINEAGAFSAWMAAGSSYSHHNQCMIPFYTYYSMFGFQRIGDFAWAAADMRVRGFLIGATSGRTTLNGEGLQHQDGHSQILASVIPNCVSYDPCFAYELAVIVHDGLKRMYEKQEDVFYYITTLNENYTHPKLPSTQTVKQDIVKGMYLFDQHQAKSKLKVRLLGSGAIFREAIEAANILNKQYHINVELWSVTSFNELKKEALAYQRWNRLHPESKPKACHVKEKLSACASPVIAVSDYMTNYADQISPYVGASFSALGTDGFGRSDSREALRDFFEVDRYSIVLAALTSLKDEGFLTTTVITQAIKDFNINQDKKADRL